MKIQKTLLFPILFGVLLALLIPSINLFNKYLKEKNNYSLEIVNDQQVLVKYDFNDKPNSFTSSPLDFIRSLIYSSNRQQASEEKINLDDSDVYFSEIDKQLKFSTSEEFSNQEFYQPGNSDTSGSLVENQSRVLIEKHDSTILSQFKDAEVIHDFDDSGLGDKEPLNLKIPEKENYQAASLEEFLNKNYQQLEKNDYTRPIQAYEVLPVNNFYTSPQPDNSRLNTWEQLNKLKLVLDKEGYYRFELIRINVITEDHININDLQIFMKRGNYIIPNVGGYNDVFLRYQDGIIYTTFAMGYNPPSGDYEILIKSKSIPEWKGINKFFKIIRRIHVPLEKGFSVVNWEYGVEINDRTFPGPRGKSGGVEKLAEWLDYMGVSAYWMLAGQTTGWDRKVSPETPWGSDIPYNNMKLMAPYTKKYGIKNGAYVMSFYTPANGKISAGYINSLGYKDGNIHDSLHISLMDKRRIQNIIDRMILFEKDPNIDFVGLDFIRTGQADGYEMGPLVIKEMNIPTPENFEKFTIEDKVKWFASKVENQNNQNLIIKWRWWRAHKVASIANQIILGAKLTKPMWVFTLGWERGHQHGQDPYMFFDAGVFIDAVMLYEANFIQFRNMMVHWPAYMTFNKNNLIMGNAADSRFLDGILDNFGLEYLRRTKTAYKTLYQNGLGKGIFLHDLSRALWSKRRYYDISEWALINGHAISEFRKNSGLIPYEGEIRFDRVVRGVNEYTGKIIIKNNSDKKLENLNVIFSPTIAYGKVSDNIPKDFEIDPGKTKEFVFKTTINSAYIDSERPFGYYIIHPNYPKYFFLNFNFNRSENFIESIKDIL